METLEKAMLDPKDDDDDIGVEVANFDLEEDRSDGKAIPQLIIINALEEAILLSRVVLQLPSLAMQGFENGSDEMIYPYVGYDWMMLDWSCYWIAPRGGLGVGCVAEQIKSRIPSLASSSGVYVALVSLRS